MKIADVIVIGAGPAGSYAAGRLAGEGLSVTVIEEHPVIGEPRFCTGILGARAFEEFPLPREPIQGSLYSATVHSPLHRTVRIARSTPQAYILNRSEFDHRLAEGAARAGALYRLGCRAEQIMVEPDGVRVTIGRNGHREVITARCCLIATGANCRLHSMVGLSPPAQFLDCVQAEFSSHQWTEVNVFFGRSVVPGSFGWAAPVGVDRVRVGVCVEGSAMSSFRNLLAKPFIADRLGEQLTPVRKRRVPITPVSSSVTDRVMLVGDAAGQVKPLTGGGIYYSIVCAHLAADTLMANASSGNFLATELRSYERAWRAAIGRDLAYGRYTRRLLSVWSDEQIDALVAFCQLDEVQALIEREADFDAHHRFFAALFKLPVFWKIIGRQLPRPLLLASTRHPRGAVLPAVATIVGDDEFSELSIGS